MAEEFKYTLNFESKASGTGAADVEKNLARISAATEQVTDKAKVSEFGFYDLDAEMAKTGKTTETLTGGLTRLAPTTRNNAQALLLFSQGFEDAQYGIRGVLNNIPGLIIAMGGTAGLAGAISIAAVSLSQILPLFTKTEEKASDMADRIKEVSDSIGQVETDRFEQVGDEIARAADEAAALAQGWEKTESAEAAYSTAALDNAAKLQIAQRLIAEALGEQVDAYAELEAIAAREAEKRRLAAEQLAAIEARKLEAAADAVTTAADNLTATETRAVREQANLQTLRAQLQALRDQRDELVKLSDQRALTDDPGRQLIGAVFPKTLPLTDEAKEARKTLADPNFQGALDAAQARVDALEEAVRGLEKTNGGLDRAAIALQAAQTKQADIAAEVAINIQKIEESAATQELVARSENIAATGELNAEALAEAVSKIETTTAQGAAAKSTIEAAAADGQITADETLNVAESLRSLIGQMQAGLATSSQNIQELIGLQRDFAGTAKSQQDEIRNLKAMIRSIQQNR